MKLFKARMAVSSLMAGPIVLLLTSTALAAVTLPTEPTPVTVTSANDLVTVIGRVIGWVYTFFFVIAILLILFAAFTYLTSGGEAEKVTKAKNSLIYAAIAVAVALLALSFTTIVRSIVGG